MSGGDIGRAALEAFNCTSPQEKARKAQALFERVRATQYGQNGQNGQSESPAMASHILSPDDLPHDGLAPDDLPLRPGRPEKPELLPPRLVPRRRITKNGGGRVALLHAIAHIELNAIDLALDMALRFADQNMPFDFVRDWLSVAADEGRHFMLLDRRLNQLGSHYGALPAHDGLWEAAITTAGDLIGRLAIAPLVLEARGLDITPHLIDKMLAIEDKDTADIFHTIMTDEIGHVAIGKKWFDYVCGCQRLDPISTWQKLVRQYFSGTLKPPFNIEARHAARFSSAFYGPLAAEQAAEQAVQKASKMGD